MAVNIASQISFADLGRLCEKISSSARDKRSEILQKFISHFREKGKTMKSENSSAEVSFYPILRLLLPQLDRERGAYGVKENTLAKLYIRILCLPKEGQDAGKLLNFRAPRMAGNEAGDFADVAFWILKKHCPEGGTLSVEQVNNHLDNIAERNASNDRRGVEAELIAILQHMPAKDQKWLIRMLLKDLKLGIGQTLIFRTFHPDAQELYDVSNNLDKVCRLLQDPSLRLNEIEVELFSPFRPMLAEQCDVQKVDEFMKNHPYFYVETKHDGERCQLHMKDGTFKYFSRNGHDFTDSYGRTAYDGILTPHIAKALRNDIRNCILDGEMMIWDKSKCFYRSKGENFDVKSLKADGYLKPCFCVFDILYLNDQVLSNKPLEERLRTMEHLFVTSEGVIVHTKRRKVSTRDEVIGELNNAIDMKLEGIMLKQPGTVYKPNSRKAGWYKIKPEYTDGVMDHVDCLIIGGYFGEGRRSRVISHFLLGLAVPHKEGEPWEFYSVAKVGSGYSNAQLEELLLKLSPHWQRIKLGQCPPGLVWTKEKPDLWIEPKHSCILEIKSTEITESSGFKMSHTLRFPRVENIRYDKNWTDCMTTTDFEVLRQQSEGKLYTRHVVANTLTPKKKRQAVSVPVTLGKQFCSADLSQVNKTSSLLMEKKFCVVTGYQELTKQDIERKIFEQGGTIVQNPGPETFCVLSNDYNIRVGNISKSGAHDIVRIEWFLRALEQEGTSLLPWTPADLIAATDSTKRKLSEKFDSYGDSFTTPATLETLQYVFTQVEKSNDAHQVSPEDMAELDIELFSGPSPYGMFRLCYAYFDKYERVNDTSSNKTSSLDIVALDFQFYGGCIHESITDSTTHVVVHSGSSSRLEEVQQLNHQRTKKFHIVTEKWVQESVEQLKRLKEDMY